MHLTKSKIKEKQLISNLEESKFRDISYDLSIDTVIRNGVEISGPEFSVWSYEMVIFVSKETVAIPPGLVGYAMPKTGLCNRGILALNTGIINPGYKGRFSSTAINFREKAVRLKQGDPFLRIIFHE